MFCTIILLPIESLQSNKTRQECPLLQALIRLHHNPQGKTSKACDSTGKYAALGNREILRLAGELQLYHQPCCFNQAIAPGCGFSLVK